MSSVNWFENFSPIWHVSIFNFVSPLNNSTNWCYLRLTVQPYWPPDKPKHVAGKTDILAIKTAEISRRQKKRNETKQSAGEIYMSQSRNYDFFVFCSGFWVSKRVMFSLLQLSECPIFTICSSENDPHVTHFYLWHLEAGGARRPPGPPFDELAQICWYYPIESQVLRFLICNLFSEFLKDKKVLL